MHLFSMIEVKFRKDSKLNSFWKFPKIQRFKNQKKLVKENGS